MNHVKFGLLCVFCLPLALAGLLLFATAMSGDLANFLIQVTAGPNHSYEESKDNAEATANLLLLLGLFAAAGAPLALLLAIRQRM